MIDIHARMGRTRREAVRVGPAVETKASTTWWMSLRTKVREVGDEGVKAKLKEFDDEVNRLRAQPQTINEAPEDSSEDEDEGTYSSPGEWAPMPLSLALSDR